jgi:hypothetical protein
MRRSGRSPVFILRFLQNRSFTKFMTVPKKLLLISPALALASVVLGGCTTNTTTNPARSATEQLLLSTAADHALQSANLHVFSGRKVFLDTNYFDSYDSKYALGTIRDALSRNGAELQDSATNSDIIIEARSGALSTDNSSYLLGIPNIGVPIPLAGVIQTPELALYKSEIQNSTAKIALLAYARESKAHVYSSGPLDGKSHNNHFKLLFISWVSTDIPEKYSKEKSIEQYQTWFPKYNPSNLPVTNGPAATSHLDNAFPTNAPTTK